MVMKENEWMCSEGHIFRMEWGYYKHGDEYRKCLEPKIGAIDSPCKKCTDKQKDYCVLMVMLRFEDGDDK